MRPFRRVVRRLAPVVLSASALALFGPPVADAGAVQSVLYASPGGTGSCASGSPCDFATALAQVAPGQAIDMAAGTYDGLFTLSTAGTSAGSPVMVQGAAGGGTVIDAQTKGTALTVASGVFATISGLTFINGSASAGAGGSCDTNGSSCDGGNAGGAISNDGTLTVSGSTFSSDTAIAGRGGTCGRKSLNCNGGNAGGAISNDGTLVVSGSTFSSDSALADAAIGCDETTCNGGNAGGAFSNDGTLTVSGSTFSSDSASAGSGGSCFTPAICNGGNAGGVVANDGTLSVTGSTFSSDSTAAGAGGTCSGLTICDGGNAGGAVSNDDTLSAVATTFASDTSTSGTAGSCSAQTTTCNPGTSAGDIANEAGATVAADIFADSCSGTFADGGYNVGTKNTCFGFPGASSDLYLLALPSTLGSLADNGGPTQTIEPRSGSVALGWIPNDPALSVTQADGTSYSLCPVAADQRGIPSAPGSACNVGAVQSSFLVSVNGASSATVPSGASATLAASGLPAGAGGTVTFSSASPVATLCSFSAAAASSCTPSASLAGGTYGGVTASFVDTDGSFPNADSANQVSFAVVPAEMTGSTPTSVTLGASPDPAVAGQEVTYSATLSPASATGTVTFSDDGSPIAGCDGVAVTNAVASCDPAYPVLGTHLISASYSGSAADAPSNAQVSEVVDLQPISGVDPIGTAIAVSEAAYPGAGSARAVVLARSDFFSDALAGGPLAAAEGGPLLLSEGADQSQSIDPRTLAEIERVLQPGGTVYVLGGTLALPASIDATLSGLGYRVVREAGADEFATALDIAAALGDPADVFEATGLDFPDALAAVPAAVATHGAILLTDGATQDPETAAYLALHPYDARFAIGGPLAAAGADPGAKAVFGQDAFGTAAAVASYFFPGASLFGVANGGTFTDALAGGVFMASGGRLGPILLVDPAGSPPVPSPVAAYLATLKKATPGYVFGGPLAVPDSVLQAIQAITG